MPTVFEIFIEYIHSKITMYVAMQHAFQNELWTENLQL